MDNIKEKLVELIGEIPCEDLGIKGFYGSRHAVNVIADHLIANGVTVQKWISVEERLPEPLVDVLVHYEDGEVCVGVWFELFSHFLGEDDDNRVTHWMPLPKPPKGE